jgi:hypothetical protein
VAEALPQKWLKNRPRERLNNIDSVPVIFILLICMNLRLHLNKAFFSLMHVSFSRFLYNVTWGSGVYFKAKDGFYIVYIVFFII